MRWQEITSDYRYALVKTTIQVIVLATLFWGVYSLCLWFVFQGQVQYAQKIEFQNVSKSLQRQVQQLQEVGDHVVSCIQKTPDMDEGGLRTILSALRLTSPLSFPDFSALTWVSEEGKVISVAKTCSPNRSLLPSQSSPQRFLQKRGNRLLFPKKIPGRGGRVVVETSLFSLKISPSFVVVGVAQNGFASPSKYTVSFPQAKAVLILKPAREPLFSLFLKEHILSLLFFGFFSLGFSSFFIMGGRRFYALARRLFARELEATQQNIQDLQKVLVGREQENKHLNQQNKLHIQTAQKREALIYDVLMRQRLMREKAYLTMAIFLEKEALEEKEEGLELWIADMRNHFGLPHIELFQLRPVVDQAMAVFAEAILQNHLQVRIDDQMDGDVIETDRLIFAIVLANILNRCIVRLPREGRLHVTLSRQKRSFKIDLLDDGYILPDAEFLSNVSRQKFFFLENDVLEGLCASIRVKITTKDRVCEDLTSMNRILFEVPLKIKRFGEEKEKETLLPSNIIRFPSKKRALSKKEPA